MSELQTIISCLNRPPFQQNLTLVSFDTKTYHELLELVIVVLHQIDPSQKDDLDPNIDEEQLTNNLIKCLKLLNYPSIRENEMFFKNEENRDLICDILHWLLTKRNELKTRAYIAKYLQSFEIPQEFLVDPILYDLLEQLKQQKVIFKNTHKELTQLINNDNMNNSNEIDSRFNNVDSLKQELRQLSNEKEQLISKLNNMKNKVDSESVKYGDNNKFLELFELTSCLRKYQEEEALLFERGHQQRRELNISAKYMQCLVNKRNDLQTIIENEGILNGLRNKISDNQLILKKLDEEYSENNQLLNEALSIIDGNEMSEIDVENLENHLNGLQGEVKELEKQRDKLLEAVDSKLGFYKKRAIGVRKKKDAAIGRLNECKSEIRELRTDIIKFDKEMDKMSVDGRRPMNEIELKQYMQILRNKTEKYKQCKLELQSERNELSILQRTNEILRSRNQNLTEYLEMKDKEKEINDKRNILQKVSAMKNELDIKKEKKLTNLADIVAKINYTLKLKKNKLQPLVKKLKERRNEFKGFQEKYSEKKKIYENMRIGYDSELNKLEDQVNALKKVVNNLETRYFRMNTQIEINEIRLEKVKMEEKYQNNHDVLDKQFKCYRDLYDSEISKLLYLSKSLRNEQGNIREGHKENIKQKQYFIHLQELIKLKLDIVEKRVNEMVMLNNDNHENEDRLVLID